MNDVVSIEAFAANQRLNSWRCVARQQNIVFNNMKGNRLSEIFLKQRVMREKAPDLARLNLCVGQLKAVAFGGGKTFIALTKAKADKLGPHFLMAPRAAVKIDIKTGVIHEKQASGF